MSDAFKLFTMLLLNICIHTKKIDSIVYCVRIQQLIMSKHCLVNERIQALYSVYWNCDLVKYAIYYFRAIFLNNAFGRAVWNKSHKICILCNITHFVKQSALSLWIFSHLKRFPNVCTKANNFLAFILIPFHFFARFGCVCYSISGCFFPSIKILFNEGKVIKRFFFFDRGESWC